MINLDDYKQFISSSNEANRIIGWYMVLNSVKLKEMSLDELKEFNILVRNYPMNIKYKTSSISKDFMPFTVPSIHFNWNLKPYQRLLLKINSQICKKTAQYEKEKSKESSE